MFRLLLFFVLMVFSFPAEAQLIVNVENSRIQSDTTGWKGTVGTSFSFSKNVEEVLNINGAFHLQYKTQKDLYLILANYNLLKANNQNYTNNMFYHLRYNRKLGKVVRWEAFTQWQQNNVTNIGLRALYGTGLRFQVKESKEVKVYAGALVMFEHEKDINPNVSYNDVRGDNYVTCTYKPNNIFDVTATTFYQASLRSPKDFRILNQITFNVKVSKHLAIITNWDYSYDAYPAAGTPRVNYTISNGINYTF